MTHRSDNPAEQPASDLGFLLHKHPDHLRSVPLSFGEAHVFWPSVSAEQATVALLVEVDPIAMVRKRHGAPGDVNGGSLAQYVNDRPYATSSFTSVALGRVFGTALAGASESHPEMAARPLLLSVQMPVVPSRGGEAVRRRIFEPLGYQVDAAALPLDTKFPEWGESRYFDVTIRGRHRLADVLNQLYVLLPVLDDDKHYWVAPDEIDKLLRRGGEWLAVHPERDLIVRRYLRHRSHLTDQAILRLTAEDADDADATAAEHDHEEAEVEKTVSLNDQRVMAVVAAVQGSGAASVVDLGCGEGRLVKALMREPHLRRVAGMDVSHRALQGAARRVGLERMGDRQRQRVTLFQGSLTCRDARLADFDAATLIEVIEHLDPARLDALERVVFGAARPATVIVTTPNSEYNVRWSSLPAGNMRHRDHRFEWTRREFNQWCQGVGTRHGYGIEWRAIGPNDPEVGPPTQMAVFTR